MRNKQDKYIDRLFFLLIFISDLYLIFVKLHYGMYWDESFLLAQAECFSRDIDFFKDSWSPLQFIGVIIAPLSAVYKLFVGDNTGIIFFYRVVWLIIQNILAFVSYLILQKTEIESNGERKTISKEISAGIAICLFCYFAYFYSVNYKTVAYWGCTFIILIITDCYRRISILKTITLGIMLSLTTLAYESMAVMIIPILSSLIYISKVKNKKVKGYIISFILTCVICASLFIGYSIIRIGVTDFLRFFIKFIGHEGYDENVILKIFKHSVFFLGVLIINKISYYIYLQFLKTKFTLSRFILIYVITVIVVVMFAKPQTITISRVHYIMCVIYTLCIVILFDKNYNLNRRFYINLFVIPIGFYVLAIMIATIQGPAVSSMGCIPAIIPFFLMASNNQLKMRGAMISLIVLFLAVGMIIVPCVDTTNLTVFHNTEEIKDGPAKGTRPLEYYVNEDVSEWQEITQKYVTNNDRPFMLGNEYYSIGFMCSDVSIYGTYSPGYIKWNSDRMVDFWNMNEKCQPTVAIIKMTDIPCDFDLFLKEYPIGQYLNDKFDNTWIYDGKYAIAKF